MSFLCEFYHLCFLVQACPHLIGKPKNIQKLLEKTAQPLLVPFGVNPCGRDNFTSVPNNFFGAGELNIEAAISSCLLEIETLINKTITGSTIQ